MCRTSTVEEAKESTLIKKHIHRLVIPQIKIGKIVLLILIAQNKSLDALNAAQKTAPLCKLPVWEKLGMTATNWTF